MSAYHKYMDFHDLCSIQHSLDDGLSFSSIASLLGKDCTTISKCVRRNLIIKHSGTYGRIFNDCALRHSCKLTAICSSCNHKPAFSCRNCPSCHSVCKVYQKEVCPNLSLPPYVCNACPKRRSSCTLTKHIFDAAEAYRKMKVRIQEAHSGMILSQSDIDLLDSIFTDAVKVKNQSIHHVFVDHQDSIMISERSVYKAIDKGILNVKNIDLQNKVKLRPRRKKGSVHKIDRSCRIDRSYDDYRRFMEEHPDTPVVQMDTVEGIKGGKVLLTLHFVDSSFMLAYIRDHNDAHSVKDIFKSFYDKLGKETYMKLFQVILTDNGTEFSDPRSIEFNDDGEKLCHVFYCDPARPDQKGSCEVNHELIRRILPKGTSFDPFEQKDIALMMSHIDSYKRKKLNDRSPYQLFSFIYGFHTLEAFGISSIPSTEVILSPSLLKKENS